MRRIWRALTRRLLLKFTALVCAAVLWVAACAATSSVRTFEVPAQVYTCWPGPMTSVDVTGVAKWPDGVPVAERPLRIRVTVRGPSDAVAGLEPRDVDAWLAIESIFRKPGTPAGAQPRSFTLGPRNATVKDAPGVVVTRVEPREVRLKIEPF